MADISRELSEAIKHNHLYCHEEVLRKKIYLTGTTGYTFRPFATPHIIQHGSFSSIVHLAEGTSPFPGDPTILPVATYTVQLKASGDSNGHLEQIKFWKEPRTGMDFKQQIEKIMNIPVSTQSLLFREKLIIDTMVLTAMKITEREIVEVRYESEADIHPVWTGYKWFHYIHCLSSGLHCSVWTGLPVELEYIITVGLREDLPGSLVTLLGGGEKRNSANREYFEQLGGMKAVLKVHETVCMDDWRCLPLPLKLVEIGCVQVLSSMTRGFSINTGLARLDFVGFVIRSLMRNKVRRGTVVRETSGTTGCQNHNDFLATELIRACLQFLANISERKPLHEDVISSSELVEQLVNLTHCPSISTVDTQNIICILGSTLWCSDSWRWLTNKASILEGIVDAVKARKKMEGQDEKEILVLEFYVSILLSALVLTTSYQISRRLHTRIAHYLENFLSQYIPPSYIKRKLFEKSPLGSNPWQAALKILYPYQEESVDWAHYRKDTKIMRQMHHMGTEVMIFTLEVLLTEDRRRSWLKLREVGLMDYFVCLPRYVPARLKDRGVRLVQGICPNGVPLPALEAMARVCLAKHFFGLQNIVGREVEDIYLGVKPRLKANPVHLERKQPLTEHIIKNLPF